ncbi:MAG TPA: LuxR C-terminal-related transcriptional regulator [Solirubrobacteraceae bacterium]|jgi:DNA-binding CsgD family transcriptional regulator|nr:LuxR C-terminal-related transcriptional regulator [Solirubrobacteraceae bacterium]
MSTIHDRDELEIVRMRLAVVDGKLAELGHTREAREHREAIEQLRQGYERRSTSLARAHDAAAALRRFSSPAELLRHAPRALAEGTPFRRVLLSTIRDGSLLAVAAHFATSADSQAEVDPETDADRARDVVTQLRKSPPQLTHNLVESDVMRRRRAKLVSVVDGNDRVDPRLTETIGWSAYVAAPLTSGAAVIGMIHADLGAGMPVDVLARDMLGQFASVLSQVHESAELRRTLLRERDAVRRFLERLNALSISLADTPMTLGGRPDPGTAVMTLMPTVVSIAFSDATKDDRLVFSGLLTRRELDVLRLLADGHTNRTIADTLVLADTTVKFHVNSILRKLHVANRAEAVARYLSLLGTSSLP